VLALRSTTVTAVVGSWLETELGRAWSDPALHPPAAVGDAVVVNVQARELGLGSGGYDLVVANLTRGLAADGRGDAHVMKLNYTPLQHAVEPVDGGVGGLGGAVGVISLHGQLAPLAWGFAQAEGGRLGYVQTAGGALPGGLSRTVAQLRERGWLSAHVTAGPAYGGADGEAISTAGAIAALLGGAVPAPAGGDAAAVGAPPGLPRCDAVVCGPGPGILGSGTALGHGGLVALDSAHAALALGRPTLLAARVSDGDPRERHRGVSHHTRTVLDLLLAPVVVALPDGVELAGSRHDRRAASGALDGFPWPLRSMGREDPAFFAAAAAAGRTLADIIPRQ
jgi:hypothetical protein